MERHCETLDFKTLAQDRAEAPIRAQFDPSKEAAQARRYESAARRGFFKAIEEYRAAESIPAPESASASQSGKKASGTLASSCAGHFSNPNMPMPGMVMPPYVRPADPRDVVPLPDDGSPKGKVTGRTVL